MYKWCAVRCAVVMLSRLAAAVSRRTRQRPAETTKVAVQPPQDASEVQLAQLRARYHLPMASVAELLGFVEKSGDGDTKRGYETLLAIRQRRSTHHSGEHCSKSLPHTIRTSLSFSVLKFND